MKDGIHPEYPVAQITCACGNTFITHSTRGDFQVDVCGACHPFYTGTQKLLDTAGRVDRFRKRYEPKKAKDARIAAAAAAATAAEATPASAAPPAPEDEPKP
jgi:large subunit ribosomal protein L31